MDRSTGEQIWTGVQENNFGQEYKRTFFDKSTGEQIFDRSTGEQIFDS